MGGGGGGGGHTHPFTHGGGAKVQRRDWSRRVGGGGGIPLGSSEHFSHSLRCGGGLPCLPCSVCVHVWVEALHACVQSSGGSDAVVTVKRVSASGVTPSTGSILQLITRPCVRSASFHASCVPAPSMRKLMRAAGTWLCAAHAAELDAGVCAHMRMLGFIIFSCRA